MNRFFEIGFARRLDNEETAGLELWAECLGWGLSLRMGSFFLCLSVAFLFSRGPCSFGDERSTDPGFEVFRDQCMACHLETGLGIEAMNAPSIAGLPRWYVTDQLRKFRSDQRGYHSEDVSGKLMQANAIVLDERTIAFVGRHVENLPPNSNRKTAASESVDASEALFLQNCAECHGNDANGDRARRAPPLTSQQDWYLLNQIENFRAGKRNHGDYASVSDLSPEELKSIVAWIADLPAGSE